MSGTSHSLPRSRRAGSPGMALSPRRSLSGTAVGAALALSGAVPTAQPISCHDTRNHEME